LFAAAAFDAPCGSGAPATGWGATTVSASSRIDDTIALDPQVTLRLLLKDDRLIMPAGSAIGEPSGSSAHFILFCCQLKSYYEAVFPAIARSQLARKCGRRTRYRFVCSPTLFEYGAWDGRIRWITGSN
jgi:hypothetical protein